MDLQYLPSTSLVYKCCWVAPQWNLSWSLLVLQWFLSGSWVLSLVPCGAVQLVKSLFHVKSLFLKVFFFFTGSSEWSNSQPAVWPANEVFRCVPVRISNRLALQPQRYPNKASRQLRKSGLPTWCTLAGKKTMQVHYSNLETEIKAYKAGRIEVSIDLLLSMFYFKPILLCTIGALPVPQCSNHSHGTINK